MKKRVLTLFLVCLLLSIVPTIVLAEENSQTGAQTSVTAAANSYEDVSARLVPAGGIYTYWIRFGYYYSNYGIEAEVLATTDETPVDISSAAITLSKTTYTYNGKERKPTPAVVIDGVTLVEGVDYTVSYYDNTSAGTGYVVITGIGDYTGTAEAVFTINQKSLSSASVTFLSDEYTYNGASRKPSPVVVVTWSDGSTTTLEKNTDYTVSYSNNKNVGTAVVTVKGTGNYKGSVNGNFTIIQKNISSTSSDAVVTLSTGSYTYDGTSKKPVPVVKITLNGSSATLKQGTDYTVSYSNNKSAGTATVTINGTGNYTGTLEKTFTIKAKSIKSGSAKLKTTICTYSGSSNKPSVNYVKITLNGSTKTLTNGTDYTISYSDNKSIGTATVTITGTGNYTGTITKTFKIKPAKATVSSLKSSGSGKLTAKWKKVSGSVTGYQIRYKVKGTSTWKTKTVSALKLSTSISGLKSGKTYQVQVRAYKTVSGTKYYGSWSVAKAVKVK